MTLKWLTYILLCAVSLVAGIFLSAWFSKGASSGQSLAYVDQGVSYAEAKDYPRAIAALNRALALDDNSFIAHLSLANAYDKSGARELAIEEYQAALSLSEREGRFPNEQAHIKQKIAELRAAPAPK